jgi:hypothetical protein
VPGSDRQSGSLFLYVDLEARVRRDHPLRAIREIANTALEELNEDLAVLHPRSWGTLDLTGASVTGDAAASFLWHPR